MTKTHYFVGYEPDGDESGPGDGDFFDGHVWVVEPDDPEPEPYVLYRVSDEDDAKAIVDLLTTRDRLLEACEAVLDRHNYQGTGAPWPHLFDRVRAAVRLAKGNLVPDAEPQPFDVGGES